VTQSKPACKKQTSQLPRSDLLLPIHSPCPFPPTPPPYTHLPHLAPPVTVSSPINVTTPVKQTSIQNSLGNPHDVLGKLADTATTAPLQVATLVSTVLTAIAAALGIGPLPALPPLPPLGR